MLLLISNLTQVQDLRQVFEHQTRRLIILAKHSETVLKPILP
jgi:hypothetical protein